MQSAHFHHSAQPTRTAHKKIYHSYQNTSNVISLYNTTRDIDQKQSIGGETINYRREIVNLSQSRNREESPYQKYSVHGQSQNAFQIVQRALYKQERVHTAYP